MLRPGMYIEDCNFHPCVVVEVFNTPNEPNYGTIHSLSLINPQTKGHASRAFAGDWNSGCSAWHCGVRVLTEAEAVEWVINGPSDEDLEGRAWWDRESKALINYMSQPDVFAKYRKPNRKEGKCYRFPAKADRNAKRKPYEQWAFLDEYHARRRQQKEGGKV
jgi:hypothetical protein